MSTRELGLLWTLPGRSLRKAGGSQRIVDRLADLRLQRSGVALDPGPSERDRFAGEKLGEEGQMDSRAWALVHCSNATMRFPA